MRAVLQRVLSARVEVDGRVVSSIGPGILVLVGLLDTDTEADAEYICRKTLNTRLFPNEKTGRAWDQSVIQRNFEVLLVSQFTLYGQLKGNKLDFHVAMPPDRAKPFYESLVRRVATAYRADAVKDGIFGAMMQVHLVNDGPVTIQLDSQKINSSLKEVDQSSHQRVRAVLREGKGYFLSNAHSCDIIKRCKTVLRFPSSSVVRITSHKTDGRVCTSSAVRQSNQWGPLRGLQMLPCASF